MENTKKLEEEKPEEDGRPAVFTYLEPEECLVVGFTDGRVHLYRAGVLADVYKYAKYCYPQVHK